MTDYNNPSEVEWLDHEERIAESQDEHGYVVAHRVEMFVADEPKFRPYGWQCFTCGEESEGFDTLIAAERAGNEHIVDPA